MNKTAINFKDAVKRAPLPKLRTRYQKTSFAASIARLLTEHQDTEVQKLALMIQTLLAAPHSQVQAMLEIELTECSKLKLMAMKVEGAANDEMD